MTRKDIRGMKFNRWLVLNEENYEIVDIDKRGVKIYKVKCICECGVVKYVNRGSILSGASKSCGCMRAEAVILARKRYNIYDLSGTYGIGYDSNNRDFYFDLEDYDKIKEYSWYVSNGYAMAYDCETGKRQRAHRIIINCPEGMFVDHIDGVRKDNRKSNLRVCSIQENTMNTGKRKNNISGVTGVSWRTDISKWLAHITYCGKLINLGHYDNFEDACKTRSEAEDLYFGEFAYKNSNNKERLNID